MYVPHHFATDPDLSLVTTADLITPSSDGLVASFLPVVWDGSAFLGHLARANPHWRVPPAGESLLIARGPDAYISPRWYASKAEHGRVVPTWNYSQVHAYGSVEFIEDPEFLLDVVTRLTDRFEASLPGQPWHVNDAPAAFVEGQLRAIIGVRLVVNRLEAKAKLSQNRSLADRQGVLAGLGPDDPVGRGVAETL